LPLFIDSLTNMITFHCLYAVSFDFLNLFYAIPYLLKLVILIPKNSINDNDLYITLFRTFDSIVGHLEDVENGSDSDLKQKVDDTYGLLFFMFSDIIKSNTNLIENNMVDILNSFMHNFGNIVSSGCIIKNDSLITMTMNILQEIFEHMPNLAWGIYKDLFNNLHKHMMLYGDSDSPGLLQSCAFGLGNVVSVGPRELYSSSDIQEIILYLLKMIEKWGNKKRLWTCS